MEVRQILIWVKGHFTLGRQDYQWQHEPCLYGWKDGAAHYFLDSRKQSTVIEDLLPDLSKMKKAMTNAKNALREGGAFYVWYATRTTEQFLAGLKKAGLDVRQILIWVKSHFTLGRQDYQWQHEPCLYGWKDGAGHYFLDNRKQSTVIEDQLPDLSKMKKSEMEALLKEIYAEEIPTDVIHEAKPNVSELHPTMKPIKLIARQIRNSSQPGEKVLDLFGGSGTTLIACEQMDRKCFMMEFDPHYADVIVDRWEKMTGKKAVLVSSYTTGGGQQ